MEDKYKSFAENTEAAEALSDLAKEALKFGKSSEAVTEADQKSSSEYNASLSDALHAINKEISDCDNPEEKAVLYKQREDILNRMRDEKENQRQYNTQREEQDRHQAKGFFAVVSAVALGAGAVAAKYLLEQKKS